MKAVSPIAGVSLYTPGQINPYDYTVVFLGDYRFTEYREGKGSHSWVDIDASKYTGGKTPVLAVMDGLVVKVRRLSVGFGYHVVLEHRGVPDPETPSSLTTLYSCYCHLSEILVSEGARVECGQMIALTGNTGNSTGPHLHFQIDKQSAPFHPYWPFTEAERIARGLSFADAVSTGLGQDNVRRYCINPLVYIQGFYSGTVGLYGDIASSPYKDAIQECTDKKIFQWYSDQTFHPFAPMTRAESLKTLFIAAQKPLETRAAEQEFKDVDPNGWYAPFVSTAFHNGWIAGYTDGTFRPHQTVTRAEFLTLVFRFFDLPTLTAPAALPYSDIPANEWYRSVFEQAYQRGLLTFINRSVRSSLALPHEPLRRDEAASILARIV